MATVVDGLFGFCVDFLYSLAAVLGISYQAINIWIFCILWPLLTLGLVAVIIRQRRRIRSLEEEAKGCRVDDAKGGSASS
jgi:hypothetical protein